MQDTVAVSREFAEGAEIAQDPVDRVGLSVVAHGYLSAGPRAEAEVAGGGYVVRQSQSSIVQSHGSPGVAERGVCGDLHRAAAGDDGGSGIVVGEGSIVENESTCSARVQLTGAGDLGGAGVEEGEGLPGIHRDGAGGVAEGDVAAIAVGSGDAERAVVDGQGTVAEAADGIHLHGAGAGDGGAAVIGVCAEQGKCAGAIGRERATGGDVGQDAVQGIDIRAIDGEGGARGAEVEVTDGGHAVAGAGQFKNTAIDRGRPAGSAETGVGGDLDRTAGDAGAAVVSVHPGEHEGSRARFGEQITVAGDNP